MGYQYDRHTRLVVDVAEEIHDCAACGPIEVARGLICQQDRGTDHSARAIATRCCSPPESSVGSCSRRARHVYDAERLVHSPIDLAPGSPSSTSGIATFARAERNGSKSNVWRTYRSSGVASATTRPTFIFATSAPSTMTCR